MSFKVSNIQVKNGTSEWDVTGKIKKSYVNFDLPIGIPIPPMTKTIKMNSFECKITISHFHPNPATPKNAKFRGDVFYENDRWGRSFLTRIQTRFDHEPSIDLYSKYNDEILQKSLQTVNRVLKVSRFVLNKFFINHLILEDIESYSTKLFDETDKEILGGIVGMNPGTLETVVGSFPISSDDQNVLEDYLENNKEIPLYYSLLKNSEDNLFLQNYRTAIIECESAFETCVIKILYANFIQNGDSPEVAENKLQRTGFTNLLKDHLDRYLQTPFYESTEYDDWKNKCYDIRNKLVHVGKIPSNSEVKDGIDVARKAIDFLIQNRILPS